MPGNTPPDSFAPLAMLDVAFGGYDFIWVSLIPPARFPATREKKPLKLESSENISARQCPSVGQQWCFP
jgi:hypothetical protein